MTKAESARRLIEKFPNLSKKKLGELLYKDNPFLFKDAEEGRRYIRMVTGTGGKGDRSIVTDKYQGVLPQGEKNDFSPFILTGKRIGILSDIHIPYHDLDALNIALNEFKRVKVDTIVLNGDIIDCYNLSRWEKDPNQRKQFNHLSIVDKNLKDNTDLIYKYLYTFLKDKDAVI